MSPVGTPNYLTVAPDGSVGAAFSGHVSAQGIDFLHTDTSQNAAQQIRWLPDPPGGNQPGPRIIGGWGATGNHDESVLELDALSPYSTDPIRNPSQNPGLARLELTGDNNPPAAQINVQAWGASGEVIKLLLGSDGTSDYVMDSDTPPAASDLQGTYGAGLILKNPAVHPTPGGNIEGYLTALATIPVGAVGANGGLVAANNVDTGYPAGSSPSGSGKQFNHIRFMGGFTTTQGTFLNWSWTSAALVNGNMGVSVSFKNNTTTVNSATGFSPIVYIAYL